MVDWRIQTYQEVESTQTIIHDAAQQGEAEGFAAQAMIQLGGKGRRGNQWASPLGNLYLSVLLRPQGAVREWGQLSFVVAVAMSSALEPFMEEGHHKTLKWPNDILIDQKKIAGILLENGGDYLVIGTGVNLFNKPDEAICLNDIAKERFFINALRDAYLTQLSEVYALWQEKGFAPILELWLKQAHGIGQLMTARLPRSEFKGLFKTVREDGALILETPNGEEKVIHAADVYFGETA